MKKTRITVATVILIAMVGLASAGAGGEGGGIGGGCLSRQALGSHTQTYDNLYIDKLVSGNVVTYLLNTVAKDDASVIGYCVYPNPGFTGSDDDLTPLYAGWAVSHQNNKDYFGFERGQGSNNIPIDGATDIEIGKAEYENLPTSEIVLFHIDDPEECGEEETCWRRQGTPNFPIPETATVILLSMGMVGLFLIVRKHKKN